MPAQSVRAHTASATRLKIPAAAPISRYTCNANSTCSIPRSYDKPTRRTGPNSMGRSTTVPNLPSNWKCRHSNCKLDLIVREGSLRCPAGHGDNPPPKSQTEYDLVNEKNYMYSTKAPGYS